MERKLTDDQLSELCSYMRVIDLMKANDHILVEHAVFKKEFEKLCKKVAEIMDVLSEEERDMVLEEHRIQLQQLEKEVTKKSTKKRKK